MQLDVSPEEKMLKLITLWDKRRNRKPCRAKGRVGDRWYWCCHDLPPRVMMRRRKKQQYQRRYQTHQIMFVCVKSTCLPHRTTGDIKQNATHYHSKSREYQYLCHADCILQLYVTTAAKLLDNTNGQTNKTKCNMKNVYFSTKRIHSMWWHGVVVELSTSTLTSTASPGLNS